MREGWICSKCNRSISPDEKQCNCGDTTVYPVIPYVPIPYYPYYPYYIPPIWNDHIIWC